MNIGTHTRKALLWAALAAVTALVLGCSTMGGDGGSKVTLSGTEEFLQWQLPPPVAAR